MTTRSTRTTAGSDIATGIGLALVIALLWATLAAVRPGTTLHLGPLLVPVVPSLVMAGGRRAALTTIVAAILGLALIAILAATGMLDGPALPPFPDATVESLVFLAAGTAVGLVISLSRS